jgi:hypothetical protein
MVPKMPAIVNWMRLTASPAYGKAAAAFAAKDYPDYYKLKMGNSRTQIVMYVLK